jgi:hypothetical protein
VANKGWKLEMEIVFCGGLPLVSPTLKSTKDTDTKPKDNNVLRSCVYRQDCIVFESEFDNIFHEDCLIYPSFVVRVY